jgi:hypothetical protein
MSNVTLSGNIANNLELINRVTFDLPSGPSLAIRLRRRLEKAKGPSRFVLMDRGIFLDWLKDSGTCAFWLSADRKRVQAKFDTQPTSKTVAVARYVADCIDGQNITAYLNTNPLDLRRCNLKKQSIGPALDRTILPRVRDVLRDYRQGVKGLVWERDLGFSLLHPDLINLTDFTVAGH